MDQKDETVRLIVIYSASGVFVFVLWLCGWCDVWRVHCGGVCGGGVCVGCGCVGCVVVCWVCVCGGREGGEGGVSLCVCVCSTRTQISR